MALVCWRRAQLGPKAAKSNGGWRHLTPTCISLLVLSTSPVVAAAQLRRPAASGQRPQSTKATTTGRRGGFAPVACRASISASTQHNHPLPRPHPRQYCVQLCNVVHSPRLSCTPPARPAYPHLQLQQQVACTAYKQVLTTYRCNRPVEFTFESTHQRHQGMHTVPITSDPRALGSPSLFFFHLFFFHRPFGTDPTSTLAQQLIRRNLLHYCRF
jgi:hypothetical protein